MASDREAMQMGSVDENLQVVWPDCFRLEPTDSAFGPGIDIPANLIVSDVSPATANSTEVRP